LAVSIDRAAVKTTPAAHRSDAADTVGAADGQPAPTPQIAHAVPVQGLLAVPVRRVADDADPLGGTAVSGGVSDALRRRHGAGSPLPQGLSDGFGAHFNTDFSGVRVHSDAEAGHLASSLQSTAFTHGTDVYFAPGAYQPGSPRGQRLLAHELSHVAAQQNGTDQAVGGPLTVGRAADPAEAAADRSADRAMAALRRSALSGGAPAVDANPHTAGVPAALRRTSAAPIRREKPKKDGGAVGVTPATPKGLAREATEAFAAAKPLNTNYIDFQEATNAWVKQDQQKKITDVGGKSTGKAKADKRSVKELLRAFLLAQFTEVISEKMGADERTDTGDLAAPSPQLQARIDKTYLSRTLQERDKYKGLIEKGPYAPETVSWLRLAGFDRAITKDADQLAVEAGGPRIDVRATFIGGTILGMRQRMHLFIVYTSSEGKQTYFRGGPDQDDLYTECDVGDYEPGIVDWDPSAPKVTVLKGDKAKAKLDALHEAASQINGLKVPYSGVDVKLNSGGLGGLEAIVSGENCNSTAWTILNRAGVPTKKPTGLHPGWGHVLGDLKGQGTGGAMPQKDTATSGVAALIDGQPNATVQVYADRAATEKLDTVAGGTAVDKISDDAAMTRIKFGPANTIGWVKSATVVKAPEPRKVGRRFWVAGKANQLVPMIGENRQDLYADGQNPIEVLDDTFVVGQNKMVRVRYYDPMARAEFEGQIAGDKLTDVDPKAPVVQPVAAKTDNAAAAKPEKPGVERGGPARELKPVTTTMAIPLYNEDGSRHEKKGVTGSGTPRTVTPTGQVTDGRPKMVEFTVLDPHVQAWMSDGEWLRVFRTPYPG
jgi:hypothetical protein